MAKKKNQDTLLAALTHISGMFAFIVGPLVVYLVAEEDDTFSVANAKTALNWQLSLMIYVVVSSILVIVLIGIFMLIGLFVMNVIVSTIAAIKAKEHEVYEYPMCIRFLS